MSTRCNIIVRDDKRSFTLYHHCDGYPEGVGLDLYNKFESRLKSEYKIDAVTVVNELLKDEEDKGYELTRGLHADIEYLYEIDLVFGWIKCKRVSNWENLQIIEFIELSDVKPEEIR